MQSQKQGNYTLRSRKITQNQESYTHLSDGTAVDANVTRVPEGNVGCVPIRAAVVSQDISDAIDCHEQPIPAVAMRSQQQDTIVVITIGAVGVRAIAVCRIAGVHSLKACMDPQCIVRGGVTTRSHNGVTSMGCKGVTSSDLWDLPHGRLGIRAMMGAAGRFLQNRAP